VKRRNWKVPGAIMVLATWAAYRIVRPEPESEVAAARRIAGYFGRSRAPGRYE
jgi:hypothetical protein